MGLKKSCNDCRALEHASVGFRCGLGYATIDKTFKGLTVGGIPQEPCPKPITYNQLFSAPKKE